MNIITWAHLIGTLGMFGVILFVQIVHYPLMARGWGKERFGEYARAHTDRTGFVVGPLMIPEFGAALWLALIPLATPTLNLLAWIGLALLILIWAVTGLVSVPAILASCAGLTLGCTEGLCPAIGFGRHSGRFAYRSPCGWRGSRSPEASGGKTAPPSPEDEAAAHTVGQGEALQPQPDVHLDHEDVVGRSAEKRIDVTRKSKSPTPELAAC